MTPKYTHDCDACQFLGQFENAGVVYDAYHCAGALDGPTLVARYGDEGRKYWSGSIQTLEYNNRFEDPDYIGTRVLRMLEAHTEGK